MHLRIEHLRLMSDEEIEAELNVIRSAEKEHRRAGRFGLAYYWASLGTEMVGEITRRYAVEEGKRHLQMTFPDCAPRVSPELRKRI